VFSFDTPESTENVVTLGNACLLLVITAMFFRSDKHSPKLKSVGKIPEGGGGRSVWLEF